MRARLMMRTRLLVALCALIGGTFAQVDFCDYSGTVSQSLDELRNSLEMYRTPESANVLNSLVQSITAYVTGGGDIGDTRQITGYLFDELNGDHIALMIALMDADSQLSRIGFSLPDLIEGVLGFHCAGASYEVDTTADSPDDFCDYSGTVSLSLDELRNSLEMYRTPESASVLNSLTQSITAYVTGGGDIGDTRAITEYLLDELNDDHIALMIALMDAESQLSRFGFSLPDLIEAVLRTHCAGAFYEVDTTADSPDEFCDYSGTVSQSDDDLEELRNSLEMYRTPESANVLNSLVQSITAYVTGGGDIGDTRAITEYLLEELNDDHIALMIALMDAESQLSRFGFSLPDLIEAVLSIHCGDGSGSGDGRIPSDWRDLVPTGGNGLIHEHLCEYSGSGHPLEEFHEFLESEVGSTRDENSDSLHEIIIAFIMSGVDSGSTLIEIAERLLEDLSEHPYTLILALLEDEYDLNSRGFSSESLLELVDDLLILYCGRTTTPEPTTPPRPAVINEDGSLAVELITTDVIEDLISQLRALGGAVPPGWTLELLQEALDASLALDLSDTYTRYILLQLYGNDPGEWSEEQVARVLVDGLYTALTNAERRSMEGGQDLTFAEQRQLWDDNEAEQTRIGEEQAAEVDLNTASCADIQDFLPDILSRRSLISQISPAALLECFVNDPSAFSRGDCRQHAELMAALRTAGVTAAQINECELCRPCMTDAQVQEVTSDASDADRLEMAGESSGSRTPSANRALARGIRDTLAPDTMTADEVREIAGVIGYLAREVIEEIPASALRDSLPDLAPELADSPVTSQIIRQQLTDEDPAVFVANCIVEDLNPRLLQQSTAADMGVDGTTMFTCNLSMGLARRVLELYLAEQGDVFSDSQLTNLACLVAQAGMSSVYDSFSDERILFLAGLAVDCELGERQIRRLVDRVAQISGSISDDVAAEIGVFMTGRPLGDVSDCSSISAVVEGMSLREPTCRAFANGQEEAEMVNENMCVGDTRVNLRELGAILEAHVEDLGFLLCFFDTALVSLMDASALTVFAEEVTSSCMYLMSEDMRQAVITRLDQLDIQDSDIADFVGFMDELTRLPDAVLEDYASTILGHLRDIQDSYTQRTACGLPGNMNTASMTIMGEAAIQGLTAARRRRRSAQVTCSDISVAGSASVYFTAAQLATISDFPDCASTLGEIEGWSSTQLDELVTLAKVEYGSDVSTWTADNIMTTGAITAGLSVTEMGSLALDNDVMAVIGAYNFSTSQLEAGFENYLESTFSDSETGSSLDGSDLASLGEFVCGASTTVIGNIPDSAYEAAMSYIGEVVSCDEARLEAFALKAVDVVGAVVDWTAVDVATVGNIIGGIDPVHMRGLTETQIDAISTAAIALVPANTLAELSTTQISYLSTEQAEAVTAEQQEEMTNAQLVALEAAGGTIEVDTDVDSDSGAGQVAAALVRVVAPLLLPLLTHFRV